MAADFELIKQIRSGNSDAVAELYQRYAPLVWRFIFAKTRPDLHAGQDILSETFLAAIRSLKSGTTTENIPGWLIGIARNKTVDWYRERQNVATTNEETAAKSNCHTGSIVADVLDALPDDERVILEWKYLDECSVGEIAERMGKTEKSVEGLLYRARKAFRASYENAIE